MKVTWLTGILGASIMGVPMSSIAAENIALNKNTTASTQMLSAKNAVDGNAGSRWESTHGEKQEWMTVDLGSSQPLMQVVIDWEAANPEIYEVRGSNDNVKWTRLAAFKGGKFGKRTDTLSVSGNYRYLRVFAMKRSAGNYWGYSIYELKVFKKESSTGTPNTGSLNVATKKPTFASSQMQKAENGVDTNIHSRWESVHGEQPGWFAVDLGATHTLRQVLIRWEAANPETYDVQGSNDNTNWTTISSYKSGKFGARTDGHLVSGNYRFIRVYAKKRSQGNNWGYSLFELEVFGTPVDIPGGGGSTGGGSTGGGSTGGGSTSGGTVPVYTGDGIATQYPNGFLSRTAMTNPAPFPIPSTTVAPVAAPVGPDNYIPLFAAGTPVIEHIQYSEPDGTLVTVAGFRPVDRHAREAGEPWFNSDADNVAGNWNQNDEGPGRYLTFPTFYFQNRTMSLVIRDEVPAGRSRVTTYLQVHDGKFLDIGMSAFHSMNPTLAGFGWAALGGFLDLQDTPIPSTRETVARYCDADAGPFDCISDMVYLAPFNNHRCDPTWQDCKAKPADPLRVAVNPAVKNSNETFSRGDLIEITPAMFLPKGADNKALIDGGGTRYYSQEKLYVVGEGIKPWYGVRPRLNNNPLPASTLSGGTTTMSYSYTEEPFRSFQQAVENIGGQNMKRFVQGRRLFHTSFINGNHSEAPNENPSFTQHAGKIDGRFSGERCLTCHQMNGRSAAPEVGKSILNHAIVTASAGADGKPVPHPVYGMTVLQQSRVAGAPNYAVDVASFQTVDTVMLPGNKTVQLNKPVYKFNGPTPANLSVRQAPQVIGMGLIEAIDEVTILANADPFDANGDGIRGIPNWSTDPETGRKHLGRFGWKAGKGSIRHQTAQALMFDMRVSSPLYKDAVCQTNVNSQECLNKPLAPASLNSSELDTLTAYLRLLAVPAQRSQETEWEGNRRVPNEYRMNTAAIAEGKKVFDQINCSGCHTTEMKTGKNHPMAELRNQTIRPYSDFLLHDMGDELADSVVEGKATVSMWRTPPLWGLGLLSYTQETAAEMNGPNVTHGEVSRARYLHDGRARTISEAILWHGGEGKASRDQFKNLEANDRENLLAFLRSL